MKHTLKREMTEEGTSADESNTLRSEGKSEADRIKQDAAFCANVVCVCVCLCSSQ